MWEGASPPFPNQEDTIMAGSICVGGAVANPTIREGRAYADGVEAAFRLGAAAAALAGYPLTVIDPAGEAAYDQGITDAGAGLPATSCTAYAGLTSPV